MKKDYKIEIDTWIESLSSGSAGLIWEVVGALDLERKLLGKDTFEVPDDKLKDKMSYADAMNILKQLDDKGFISFKESIYTGDVTIKPSFNHLVSKLDQRLNKGSLDKSFVWFKNESLFMNLPDGSPAAISFETRSKNTAMLGVFETIFEYWQNSAELKDGWFETVVPKDELEYGIWKKLRRSAMGDWLKDTVSNIRNQKVKRSKLSKFVTLGDFDKSKRGWLFRIRKP